MFGVKLVAIYIKNEPIYIKKFLKTKISTAKKVSVFGVVLVLNLPYLG